MYSGYKSSVRYLICRYFLPLCELLFILLTVFLSAKFLVSMKFKFYCFSFSVVSFCVLSNLCPPQGHKHYSVLFSSRNFLVLAYMFRSVIHINLCPYLFWSRDQTFSSFPCRDPVILASFVEKNFLFSINCFGIAPLSEINWPWKFRSISGLSIVSMDLSILMPILQSWCL